MTSQTLKQKLISNICRLYKELRPKRCEVGQEVDTEY